MSDALLRIGERVLRGCRTLTTAPAEPLLPVAFADVIADPALVIAAVWSAALPPPQPRADASFADRSFEEDDAQFAPRSGDRGTPEATAPERSRDDAVHAARFAAAPFSAPAPAGREPGASAAAAPDAARASRTAGPGTPPPAAARRPFLTAARPQPGRETVPADGEAGARSPAASAAPRRVPVALVRPARRPAAAPAAAAPPPAGPNGATEPRYPTAPAPLRPATGTRTPAAAPPARAAARAVPPAAAPDRSAAPATTHMVRGAAGLASVLGAHVGRAAEPPASFPRLAPEPPRAASEPPALAAPPAAPHAASHLLAAPGASGALSAVDDDLLAATGTTAADADAVYDALEARLRAEFLRTYGSYGA